ncbi:MAG TPA: hypothetical protein VFZ91_09025 [Allosphingosinicella sp.]
MPTVVSELRDRGVGWLCKGGDGRGPFPMMVRRAQEMVIWGVAEGGNYDNILEYAFRDDGGMTFRMGNTGFTSPTYPDNAHSHIALWSVNLALGAEKYTALVISGAATNVYGAKIDYALTPVQDGIARQYGWDENWTQNDVYVTQWKANEFGWTKAHLIPDASLLTFLNGESVDEQQLVAGIKTSAHHVPLGEDKSSADVFTNGDSGLTMTHWNGFRIDPFNLFDTNPPGGPVRC